MAGLDPAIPLRRAPRHNRKTQHHISGVKAKERSEIAKWVIPTDAA
jgi:hypothetical protein